MKLLIQVWAHANLALKTHVGHMRGSIRRFNNLESHFIIWPIDNIGLPYYKRLKIHN
jgi:hypothetical protein